MKTTLVFVWALILIPVLLFTARYHNTQKPPADFRDAVKGSPIKAMGEAAIKTPEPARPGPSVSISSGAAPARIDRAARR